MKTRYDDSAVIKMLKKPENFNKNGINFLRCRLNGGESDHAETVIKQLNAGKLSVPDNLKDEVTKAYGHIPSAEGLAVILLGRAPTGVKDGSKTGSVSSTPTKEQLVVAGKLAKALSEGHLYKNRARIAPDKVPQKKEEAKETKTPVTAEKKAADKKPATGTQTRRKAPAASQKKEPEKKVGTTTA